MLKAITPYSEILYAILYLLLYLALTLQKLSILENRFSETRKVVPEIWAKTKFLSFFTEIECDKINKTLIRDFSPFQKMGTQSRDEGMIVLSHICKNFMEDPSV